MGPVNWLAVVVAAAVALAVSIAWHRQMAKSGRQRSDGSGGFVTTAVLLLLASVMLGHNFARLGAATMAAKPQLYFMQTGGIAIAFVIPAVWLTHARLRIEPARRVLDCLFWLVAYLAMGAVFWLFHA